MIPSIFHILSYSFSLKDFGPLAMGYQGTGKNLLEPESRQAVIDYLKEVEYKYVPQGIKDNPNDIHRSTTAPVYFELIRSMGI